MLGSMEGAHARIFDHKEATTQQVTQLIKDEVFMWMIAGVKYLANLVHRS